MKVSLILATKGRVEEVERFVRSLADQGHDDSELVVVDQNEDSRLDGILAATKLPFPIMHLRSKSGLSHARNVGLAAATGNIITFPDDDCWYPMGLLARVVSEFRSCPSVDGLTGRSEDGQGQASGGNFSRAQGQVNLNNVWKRGISYTIFLRSSVCSVVGSFDEELGVGTHTPFVSGEETDYLIRTVKLGFNIQYLPDLVVFHPNPVLYNSNHCSKAFRYGVGMGRVLSKHRYKLSFNLYTILRPIGGVLLSLLALRIRKAVYHLAIARGRVYGLWSSSRLASPRRQEAECLSVNSKGV
jgi:glycosyltransferase involved in cell wall biosynthesis